MRNLRLVLAAAAIGSLMALSQTSSANPLAGGLGSLGNSTPAIADDLVQKVHGWHCRKRKGWYHGHRVWHRHRRACYDTSYYYDDDYYDDYSYGYGYPYGYGAPFFSFYFDDDDHRGRRHHRYRKRKKHYGDDD
jgi:hypothetical protein